MFLHRIHLETRCREARRDLADPYQLHSTLCRAFGTPDLRCPEGQFLWRLEPELDRTGCPRLLVQSKTTPDWAAIGVQGWLAKAEAGIDIDDRLKFESVTAGRRFRFRLRANPCVTRNGKRIGLMRLEDQESWLERKGEQHGFVLPQMTAFDLMDPTQKRVDVHVSQEQIVRGRQHTGNPISVFSVLYDGILTVSDPVNFRKAVLGGIGHGKVMGLGLLSVVPIS